MPPQTERDCSELYVSDIYVRIENVDDLHVRPAKRIFQTRIHFGKSSGDGEAG
jgi:hypothetical protein